MVVWRDQKDRTKHRKWVKEHMLYSYEANWLDFTDKIMFDMEVWAGWLREDNISCWAILDYGRRTMFHFVDENEMILFKMRWG
jgi:hypothetical protein